MTFVTLACAQQLKSSPCYSDVKGTYKLDFHVKQFKIQAVQTAPVFSQNECEYQLSYTSLTPTSYT